MQEKRTVESLLKELGDIEKFINASNVIHLSSETPTSVLLDVLFSEVDNLLESESENRERMIIHLQNISILSNYISKRISN